MAISEPKQIDMTIRDESELYNPFDESFLSDDVISFLSERLKGSRGDVVLCIHAYCPLDEERARETFGRRCEELLAEKKREKRRNSLRQLLLFFIGIVFITAWLIVSSVTEGIGAEVLSIIGSFAVWEAANIWIVANPMLRLGTLILNRLSKAEIIFRYETPENV